MKTKWSVAYIERKYPPPASGDWVLRTKARLEEATGVSWTRQIANGFYVFLPRVPKDIEEGPLSDAEALAEHVGHGFFGVRNFLQLAEDTGWPLRRVLEAAKTGTKHLIFTPHVASYGGWTYINKKRERNP